MRAVILDRDGVINRKAPRGEYITRWEEVQFLPGVTDAIALLKQSGFVVTRCVAKGLIAIKELVSLDQRLRDELARAGAPIDAVYYCPHEEQPPCICRRPAPGMLFDAAREHQIGLATEWMIGDSNIDIEAGRNAGCKTARLLNSNEASKGDPDAVARSLREAIHQVPRRDEVPASRASHRYRNDVKIEIEQ